MKRRTLLELLGCTLALPAYSAFAQPRTVRVVVPLPAGSSNDHVARVLTEQMNGILGQNFVVDNKAGGNSVIGTMDVVRAAPDGATLLLASNSPLAANMAFVKNMPYDPRRDLTPIAGASLTNHVLMVNASSPIRTLPEFLAHAKKNPGKVSIGYSTTSVQLQIATMNKLGGHPIAGHPVQGLAGNDHRRRRRCAGCDADRPRQRADAGKVRPPAPASRSVRSSATRSLRSGPPSPRRCRASTSPRGMRWWVPPSCRANWSTS